ncbi:MAG: aminotransferase class V-fold PLP-dependent enzyme [Cyanobacteria bacterium]|nr:aminotransferase class V-fold PLP-dependent enzyme [Cyanobacteriota bacterium]
MQKVMAQATHLHHPHFVGHQVSAPLPSSALCDLLSSFLNNGSAVYEMGSLSTVMEKHVIRWMASKIHPTQWGNADGFLTSGGSLGNLTALLAARQVKAGFDIWTQGNSGRPVALEETRLKSLTAPEGFTFLCSEQAHYCIQRVVRILGWGEEGVIPVAVDDQFRLDVSQLSVAMEKAKTLGRQVLGVVGSACSTATGSYDPLDAIGEFCQAHQLWFHVDGAHGASALLAPEYRDRLKGIEMADSVVWDAHKMMMMPSLITAVIFKDPANSRVAFSQHASYLFEKNAHEEWYNLAHQTFECTKEMMSGKLYLSLLLHGEAVFEGFITRQHQLAEAFGRMVDECEDFQLAIAPQSNIVCFRYVPIDTDTLLSEEALDDLQVQLRHHVIQNGSYYLVQTRLPQGMFLRVSLMNPKTTLDHLAQLLETIRETARVI